MTAVETALADLSSFLEMCRRGRFDVEYDADSASHLAMEAAESALAVVTEMLERQTTPEPFESRMMFALQKELPLVGIVLAGDDEAWQKLASGVTKKMGLADATFTVSGVDCRMVGVLTERSISE